MSTHPFDTQGREHCPFMPVFGPPPIELVRGSGTEVWDTEGRRYLDFLAGIAVVSLGHANETVADAIAAQARTLVHVSNLFANPVATEAAIAVDDLLERATGHAGQVFFTNSGAEANECAIKLARKHGGRGRHTVVSTYGSFHGRTLATLAATGQPTKHEPFQPMPEGFRHVAWGDVDALDAVVDDTVAAVLVEPIQGEGGVVPAPEGYLQGVREVCDRVGALMMVDEIQTGFARTGRWFGFEHAGVAPDVVTLAKAMGNGMPIGACWARTEVAAAFRPGDHGSTYSGTALATAAVNAVIAEMRRLDAPRLARERGERLRAGLLGTATSSTATSSTASGIEGIVGCRGAGLLLGVELAPGLVAADVARAALERGLIVNAVAPDVIRLAPPLTVSEEEIDEAVALLGASIEATR